MPGKVPRGELVARAFAVPIRRKPRRMGQPRSWWRKRGHSPRSLSYRVLLDIAVTLEGHRLKPFIGFQLLDEVFSSLEKRLAKMKQSEREDTVVFHDRVSAGLYCCLGEAPAVDEEVPVQLKECRGVRAILLSEMCLNECRNLVAALRTVAVRGNGIESTHQCNGNHETPMLQIALRVIDHVADFIQDGLVHDTSDRCSKLGGPAFRSFGPSARLPSVELGRRAEDSAADRRS